MREKEAHTTLLLVRHGEPDYPETRIYARGDDPDLTARGREQAEALAQWAKGQEIAALYASPTRRTVATAEPVARALGMEMRLDGRLEERFFGAWEGLDFDTIQREDEAGFRAWKTDPIGFAPQGGETIVDLARRAGEAINGIRAAHPGRIVMVISHVGPIRVNLCEALSTPLAAYRRFHIATGSVARVDYGRRQANLTYLGLLPGSPSGWAGGET